MRCSIKRIALLLILGVAFTLILTTTRSNVAFQRQIVSKFITFDDFKPDYSQALKDAQAQGKQPDYNYPITSSSSNVPPKIHFVWFKDLYNEHLDVSTIPHEGSRSPDECREFNPEFEIKIWGAEEARQLLEEHYSWFMPVYDGYKHPIQRVDAFKYFVLLHHGGVYMDLDITCRRSLAPILNFPAWFPEASPLGVNNDLMATRAGHPLMSFMTMMLKERDYNLLFPYLTIFWSTGPKFTSDCIYSWWTSYESKQEQKPPNQDAWFVLPREFYSEQYTFFGHRPGGTWHGKDVAVVLWFVDHPMVFFAILSALILGPIIFKSRKTWLARKGQV